MSNRYRIMIAMIILAASLTACGSSPTTAAPSPVPAPAPMIVDQTCQTVPKSGIAVTVDHASDSQRTSGFVCNLPAGQKIVLVYYVADVTKEHAYVSFGGNPVLHIQADGSYMFKPTPEPVGARALQFIAVPDGSEGFKQLTAPGAVLAELPPGATQVQGIKIF